MLLQLFFHLLFPPLTVVYLFCVALSFFVVFFFQNMSISSHKDQVKICTYFLVDTLPSLLPSEKTKEESLKEMLM